MNVVTPLGRAREIGGSSFDHIAAARDVRAIIESEASKFEQAGTITPPVVEALRDSGLFWMSVPTELGGHGATVVDGIEAIEEIGFADGSAGWSLMANIGCTTAGAAFLGDDAIDMMFGGGKLPICAGMPGPAGRCVETADGYQASGKFQFGSGSLHADWIAAGMVVMDDGKPRLLPSGAPETRVCFMPRDRIEFLGNWDVSGLVGTGSVDYRVPDQFVPRGFTFERAETTPLRGSRSMTFGLLLTGSAGHAAVVMGLMKRGLAEVCEITAHKKRPGQKTTISESDVFKHEFSINEALYQAARDYTYRVFRDAEGHVLAGHDVTDAQRARIRQATTWVHKVGGEVMRFCHLWSGSETVWKDRKISQVSRDMAVATQHIIVDPTSLIDAAPVLMAEWRSTLQA